MASVLTPGSPPTHDHPGEGRGPIGEAAVTTCNPSLPPSPNWAPAFAGVVPSPCGQLVLYRQLASCRPHPSHHPGGGRGPDGKVAVTARCRSLPPSPNWAPALAGVVPSPCGQLVLYRQIASCRPHPLHLPGGGRGPGGEVAVTTRCPLLPPSPNWAPAFAGVVPSPLRAACTISTNSIVQAASLAPPRRRPGSSW